jgi:hypothetical protein
MSEFMSHFFVTINTYTIHRMLAIIVFADNYFFSFHIMLSFVFIEAEIDIIFT